MMSLSSRYQAIPKQEIADALNLLITVGLVDPDAPDPWFERISEWLSTVPGVIESRSPSTLSDYWPEMPQDLEGRDVFGQYPIYGEPE
jgi:hypothetical protein